MLTPTKGYFAVWGSSLHISGESQLQWIMPNMLHIYFASIIGFSSLFAVESPRWLMKVGKYEQATKNLSTLRNLPSDHWYVQAEIIDVRDQLEREKEATLGTKWYGIIRELFSSSANRYRLFLSVFSQLLSQW